MWSLGIMCGLIGNHAAVIILCVVGRNCFHTIGDYYCLHDRINVTNLKLYLATRTLGVFICKKGIFVSKYVHSEMDDCDPDRNPGAGS